MHSQKPRSPRQSDGTMYTYHYCYSVGLKYNKKKALSINHSLAGEKCDYSDDDVRSGFFSAKDVIVGRVKTDKPVTPVVRGCARDFSFTRRAFSARRDDDSHRNHIAIRNPPRHDSVLLSWKYWNNNYYNNRTMYAYRFYAAAFHRRVRAEEV